MKNELLIFDFFGVICSEIAPHWFGARFDEEQAKRLKEHYFKPADLGEISLEELFSKMSEELDVPLGELKKEWNALIEIDFELVAFIERLKKYYTLALLSNAPLGMVESLLVKYDLNRLFDKVFVSSKLKMAKPDPQIYTHCVNAFSAEFAAVYMIDDNPANLAPLDKLGIVPVLYKSINDISFLLKK